MIEDAQRLDSFVACFNRQPVKGLIRNLTTRVERLDVAGQAFPITVNDGNLTDNCYICDPVTGYIDYAVEETRNFATSPLLRTALTGTIKAAAIVVRASGLDRAVHVNNWLFSTNPAPAITRSTASSLRDQLVARFADHAIILRSLNTYSDKSALRALVDEGFHLLPSRQIYLFDGPAPVRLSKDMKNDQALLRKTPLEEVSDGDFTQTDYARCIKLYEQLYLEKYTPLNPQYTAAYLAEMHKAGIIHLEGLRDTEGMLVAVGGRFQYGHTLTQPLLGYDTTRPQKDGLYRLITAMAQRDAMTKRLLFNMSAGAAAFKRNRCAVPAIEYSAVYIRHLSRRRRIATRTVAKVLSGVGVPLLKRYEL
ncbi:MAG: GNAT family N-acetyltransferase [Roseobacter sp.]